MRLYEAILYEKPIPGFSATPVQLEGRDVSQEIVALNAGKARYRFYLDLCEAWGKENVRLQDIRVRSLSKRESRHLDDGWQHRTETVNAIIRVIGSHGRRFLSENSDRFHYVENPFFAHFTVDKRKEIWFVDRYTRNPILVRHQDWPGFSDGGTLRGLVEHFAAYIRGGSEINMRAFGPWPDHYCGGDLWGYGDDMQKVREEIVWILSSEEAKHG